MNVGKDIMPSVPPNPYVDPPHVSVAQKPSNSETGQDAYNIVSDTVVGINLRKADNWFQLKVLLVSLAIGVPLGAVIGASLVDPAERVGSALAGALVLGFLSVVLSVFGSGIYLMIYRAVRHWKGKHD